MKDKVLEKLELVDEYIKGACGIWSSVQPGTVPMAQVCSDMATVIDSIGDVVPFEMLKNYSEFFSSFVNFCKQCKDSNFLAKNWAQMLSSLELLEECMEELLVTCKEQRTVCNCCECGVVYPYIIPGEESGEPGSCPICGASSSEQLVVSIFQQLGLEDLRAKVKIVHINENRRIDHWIQGNCPTVQYSIENSIEGRKMSMILQSFENEECDYFVYNHSQTEEEEIASVCKELCRILKVDGIGVLHINGKISESQVQEMVDDCPVAGFCVQELKRDSIEESEAKVYLVLKQDVSFADLMEERKQRQEHIEVAEPLVTVILPAYNHVNYVEAAIESILNQTYKNIEFFVADDASSDGTIEKILKYEERIDQLKLFEQNTQGKGTLYFKEKACGKYVALTDSDDVWDNKKLEMQVAYMENHPECGACFTGGDYIDSEGRKMDTVSAFKEMNMNKEQWIAYLFEHGNCLAASSVLIRRELWVKIYNEHTPRILWQVPDLWLWINVLLESEIHIIEKELLHYRVHLKEKNCNTSAPTSDNFRRTKVEENYIWYNVIKRMDSDFFKKAFGDWFVNSKAQSELEIMCEKFFVLAKWEHTMSGALNYMYDIGQIKGVLDVMEEQYDWTRRDIAQMATKINV